MGTFFKSLLTIALFFSLPALNAMTTRGNTILDSEGRPLQLKGVNWFGFNNQSTMVDGLWGGSDSLSYDFATVVHRMQLLGFNAVRLPFSFKDLYEITPRKYTQYGQHPNLSHIQKSVTPPDRIGLITHGIPLLRFTPDRKPGLINDYLPNESTLQRFLWVVNFFAKNGFYILIDNHLREDQTVLENPERWVQLWCSLAYEISQDPISKDKVMLDLLNEPDNFGIHWEATADRPALKELYLNVMDALYAIYPNFLFFIEGTGQGGIDANWGDGFVTDPQTILKHGLSDPNPFFKALMKKPYLHQVVISPHVYPPSVTGATQNYCNMAIWNRLSKSFGYLTKQGYAVDSNPGKVFPVVIGEFGSRFIQEKDIQSMNDIVRYFNLENDGIDQKHEQIASWFYWSWNANSGDTGGIVQDNWKDIHWEKIDYLIQIGLKPWYLSP